MTTAGTPLAPPTDSAEISLYRIFVRDLVVPWHIGIYDHEQEGPQRVRFNVDLLAREARAFDADKYRQVVCYAGVVEQIRGLANEGHVNLVETLASRVADLCLADERIVEATVRAEKLDAIKDVSSVGIEITRRKDFIALDANQVVRLAGDSPE